MKIAVLISNWRWWSTLRRRTDAIHDAALATGLFIFVPSVAHASTKDGAYAYVFGAAIFAFILGLVAASWQVTNYLGRIRVFFKGFSSCLLLVWIALASSFSDGRPFLELLFDSLLFTLMSVSLPFFAAFAVFRIVAYVAKLLGRGNEREGSGL